MVLMQRISSQVELDIDGMASWTLSHFCQPNVQIWLAELVLLAYIYSERHIESEDIHLEFLGECLATSFVFGKLGAG